jgi:hypothetical protein
MLLLCLHQQLAHPLKYAARPSLCARQMFTFSICSIPLFRAKQEIQNLTAYIRIATAMLVGIANGLGSASC